MDSRGTSTLHEDLLRGVVDEAGSDDLFGAAALATAEVLLALVIEAGGTAGGDRREHQGQPSEDRGLAVAGTPPSRAGCEIALVRHDDSSLEKARELLVP